MNLKHPNLGSGERPLTVIIEGATMADDTKTIEDLTTDAKAALLEAIAKAAPSANGRGVEGLESLARAFAAVAPVGPRRGELTD